MCWYLFDKDLISMKSLMADILFALISMVVCMPILHILIFDMHTCWYLTCNDIIHVDIFYQGFLTWINTIWYVLILITLISGMHCCLIMWNLICIDSYNVLFQNLTCIYIWHRLIWYRPWSKETYYLSIIIHHSCAMILGMYWQLTRDLYVFWKLN